MAKFTKEDKINAVQSYLEGKLNTLVQNKEK